MLNFHAVALTLPLYLSLEAYGEKVVNVVLDYNSINRSDGDTIIFVFFTV